MSREAGAASSGPGSRNPRNNGGPRERRQTGVAGRLRDPEQAWSVLRRLAGRYAGYFTTRTVVRAGCEELIRSAVNEGRVVRVGVGLMRLGDWPRGPLDDYAMWSAWFDGAAAVSHHSAAELHGIGRLRPRFVHMSASGGRLPNSAGLVVLRRTLRRTDVESAGAFLVTTPLRTILDLAESGIGQIALDEVVADAVAIDRCDGDEIHTAAGTLPPHAATRLRRSVDRS
ncbi:type IV toxin-antitoxin system AbiEi family antitoxin domain-containing protein [Nocardia miyunensis]|uniref:type IV toxin-antitoxin system AbiEi family antitoxin domain-containing protein n=1 Tax=Nocardia miyunensis TaxID=282684 RepID=UPI000AE40830|nr:type IV toxin-antitoxin system AbiEi family antitoxin domain-containing protein [Nocardia miyunensis]